MSTRGTITDQPIPLDSTTSTRDDEREVQEWKKRLLYVIAIPIIVGLSLGGPPWWWTALFGTGSASSPAITGFNGGCTPYNIYAQNRWQPTGTAIRAQPSVLSTREGSYAGNSLISVNGWVHGQVAYSTNVAPWNSNVWFHLADGDGWVSFPGVRGNTTTFDQTGLASGGTPALTPAICEGTVI